MKQNTYTLLCEKDMYMARITIPKIIKFINSENNFVIVDDGTLTDSSIVELKLISPVIQIITRKDREQLVLSKISQFPKIRELRNNFAFAFKLIDIPILSIENKESRYTYTDTDIIYYKNCSDYFNRSENTHLRTDGVKISIKLQKLLLKYSWKLPYKFNAGYLSFDTKDYDLNFIETFLKNPDINNIPWLVEQTCWGLIFSNAGKCYYPKENEFLCREDLKSPIGANAVHLIGNLKKNIQTWSQISIDDTNRKEPSFKLSRNVSFADWILKSIKRVLKQ